MESAYRHHRSPEKKSAVRKWALIAGLAVMLAFGSKPAYRAVKGWRARQLASQVEELIGQRLLDEAAQKARAAYQLKATEPLVIRAVARAESANGRSPSALAFWKQLREMGAMETEDWRKLVEDLLRAGALLVADQELKDFLEKRPADVTALRLASQLSARLGRAENAMELAQRAFEVEPENRDGKLLVALLKAESAVPDIRSGGVALLLELAGEPNKHGLDALTALSRRRDLTTAQLEPLVGLVRANPEASDEQRLVGVEIALRLHEDQAEEILRKAVEEAMQGAPERRRALGTWLNQRKRFEAALGLVSEKEAFGRKDLLLVRLDAMAALNQWEGVKQILKRRDVPLDEVYRELFLARCAMEQGENSKADLHWRRAHLAGAASPEHAWFVASYAERLGQTEQAEVAYRSLTTKATTARAAYEALLRMAGKRQDVGALWGLLRAMRERWPGDTAVENDYAYFSLLKETDVDAAFRSAQRLVQADPSSLPHRTTLALALLRLGQPVVALSVYEGLKIPWDQVPGSQRSVYAAVLSANGKVEEARTELRGIRVEELRPEERKLLEALGSAAGQG